MQKQDEWLNVKGDCEYHQMQYVRPYESTQTFVQWLVDQEVLKPSESQRILDVGCGAGANVHFLGKEFPASHIMGVDLNPALVETGNKLLDEYGAVNCKLEQCDIYAPNLEGSFDGVVSLQTLSWFPEFVKPLTAMAGMADKWIAITSLFTEDDLNVTIKVDDYHDPVNGKPGEYYYNVYSLKLVEKALRGMGFKTFEFIKYQATQPIQSRNPGGLGTRTVQNVVGDLMQFCGPIYLPWYFVLARR